MIDTGSHLENFAINHNIARIIYIERVESVHQPFWSVTHVLRCTLFPINFSESIIAYGIKISSNWIRLGLKPVTHVNAFHKKQEFLVLKLL
jgi:hypothetical protein